ncbi:MAG: DNA repair protein RecN, partial [Verrucomicrobiales bacterium]
REAYRGAWRGWREATEALEEARRAREIGEQEKDLLKFQVEEIEGAGIVPGEESELEELYRRSSNAARLRELAGGALRVLGGSLGEEVDELQRGVRELARIDPSLENFLESLDTVRVELDELEGSLRDYVEEVEVDPEEAQRVEERFNLLESLKRKYGPGLEDVVERGREAAARLAASENRAGHLAKLEEAVAAALEQVQRAGRKLSRKRRKAAGELAAEIRGHLVDLGFKQSEFEVGLEAAGQPGALGLEEIDFLFGPNPGEPLKPMKQIASSGEISRVMLAIKNALADQDATPLMVFDEIDANVGGEIARAVGRKMAALGERHQVVSITHFPQVAAVARRHFVVEKSVSGGRTLSRLTAVEGEARVAELVRMLGGGGEQAEAMARALLAE